RYLDEPNRADVLRIMDDEPVWCASLLAVTEARITLCRMVDEPALSEVLTHLEADASLLALVPVDDSCLERAAEIGCATGVRTLDAVHLAAADRLPRPIRFLTFDHRQSAAADGLGFEAVVPG
ncbi:MAG: PIN domain-containing protein, partial [Actinobacteria bacterium]|nr:PIN domain-containing protein [Actinomycetota bacterium]